MSHAGPPPPDPDQPDPNQPDPGQAGAAGQPPDPYGAPPPPNPYGEPAPYGQQPAPYAEPTPYGQPPTPYGQPAPYAGAQPGGAPPPNPYGGDRRATAPAFGFGGYASWLSRVAAWVIDGVLGALAGFPLWIGYAMLFSGATTTTDANGVEHLHLDHSSASTLLIWLGVITSLAFFIWNYCFRQGRTGATIGKSVLAIRMVNDNMQPIGAGLAFLRYLLNIVNAIPCYLGYFWPIWDAKKQTFADKIMSTYVITAVTPQPPVY
jgi:uncharacterized RDD family membrane protein YckC